MSTHAHALEQAILARAERLAEEYRERGKRSRDAILRDAADKLRLREQREDAIAKSLGERTYRQQVQAQELRLQSHLDRTRWNLVRQVEARLVEQLEQHQTDSAAYLQTLRGFIVTAATQIERDALIVYANAADIAVLTRHWHEIQVAMPANKTITLATEQPLSTRGGVLIISADERIRVDNTFEGRQARLNTRIAQCILEQLLPGSFETGNLFGG